MNKYYTISKISYKRDDVDGFGQIQCFFYLLILRGVVILLNGERWGVVAPYPPPPSLVLLIIHTYTFSLIPPPPQRVKLMGNDYDLNANIDVLTSSSAKWRANTILFLDELGLAAQNNKRTLKVC